MSTEAEKEAREALTEVERAQAGLDADLLRQIAEWMSREVGHEETAKRVNLIADRHDRLAAGFRRAPGPTGQDPVTGQAQQNGPGAARKRA